ncbi:hypothetical protein DFH07DRAFT_338753 [Mycena maculata]|uniref:Uncharacterized protein n=1 Tax=Mycena maculata TaxID=230809 RepID=A0AAD7HDT3_9AGAR|nr:hypothetical protein DFH07DRAFT_338753 [Mycena maculata]
MWSSGGDSGQRRVVPSSAVVEYRYEQELSLCVRLTGSSYMIAETTPGQPSQTISPHTKRRQPGDREAARFRTRRPRPEGSKISSVHVGEDPADRIYIDRTRGGCGCSRGCCSHKSDFSLVCQRTSLRARACSQTHHPWPLRFAECTYGTSSSAPPLLCVPELIPIPIPAGGAARDRGAGGAVSAIRGRSTGRADIQDEAVPSGARDRRGMRMVTMRTAPSATSASP